MRTCGLPVALALYGNIARGRTSSLRTLGVPYRLVVIRTNGVGSTRLVREIAQQRRGDLIPDEAGQARPGAGV